MKKSWKRKVVFYKKKRILIYSILGLFLFLGMGYSLLNTELNILGDITVKEYVAPTLYNVLKQEYKKGGYAREYSGDHQDSMAGVGSEKIYHWYGGGTTIPNKNNVIFANQCWKMMRTTDTGGVKMIYNGEAVNNQCLDTRGNHIGYNNQSKNQPMTYNYWYGTDYIYDSTTQTFKISGDTEQTNWNATTGPSLVGKYTCKNTTETSTCSNIYLVETYINASTANLLVINSNQHYSNIGDLPFGEYYANSMDRASAVGYMYDDQYQREQVTTTKNQSFANREIILTPTGLSTSYWYADSIDYGTINLNRYSLISPYQISSTSSYPNLVGKYTFRSSSQTYTDTSAMYIAGVTGSIMYYKKLEGGNLVAAYEPIVFGDSITDNGNGTYTINNPTSVTLSEWYTNYASYKNKYTCNTSSTTCTEPRLLTSTTESDYNWVNPKQEIMIGKNKSGTTLTDTLLVTYEDWYHDYNNYSDYIYTCNTDNANCTEANIMKITYYSPTGYNAKLNNYYGTSVIWDGSQYTLVNPTGADNYQTNHHYMCKEVGVKTCETVDYQYYNGIFIILKNGVTSINQVMKDLFEKNTTNSAVKTGIDAWYKKYMLDYNNYIEDTIFCNDRSIRDMGGWDDTSSSLSDIQFKEYEYSSTKDLSCTNETDMFSTLNNKAKLTYKVGLMSAPEMNLLQNSYTRKLGDYYWLISPNEYGSYGRNRRIEINGDMGSFVSNNSPLGVNPAISLKPGTEYESGDGSMANPYIVKMNGGGS